ncbi:hypothetical protein [Guptibacillus hwajinpoensis]|uniref:hypothetical protein n=1 Tax=Guptibacillus hwajinpoensis TaxID=208199 RepID=UPI00273E0E15|nr:hypothetical protein [Pseudalkalibacillus hwajinpoensis]WLR59026.1 hypothetical protein LC071_18020 [Pseudalkalibacillus hwajinpoensis]
MENLIWLLYYFLILIVLIIIYRKSADSEHYLFLKLIGYTFLGGFSLQLNDWRLPLGVLIYFLFFTKTKVNVKAKKRAVYVGLFIFLTSSIVPWVQTFLYEQPQEVALLNTNFYSGSLAEEWKHIHSNLGDENDSSKVIGFNMEISDEGTMNDFNMVVEENASPEKVHYNIELADNHEEFIVERTKVGSEGVHFADQTLTEADFFLKQIDLIKKPMLKEKDVDTYFLSASGQRTNHPQTDDESYRISTAGKEKVESSELPADALVVDVCDADCDYHEYFLFDLLEKKPQITEANVLDIAQQNSTEVKNWLESHTGG